MGAELKAHVFTDASELFYLKQSPGFVPQIRNVAFTFGCNVPDDSDVLIAFNRASYTIKSRVPRERSLFIAAEPDVIHPYSSRFLNQFGQVLTTTQKPLKTQKLHRAVCWYWWVGWDFSNQRPPLGHDYFADLEPPQMRDKIAIVTSNKCNTEYHRKRMRFIETLMQEIPEHIEVYGRGFKPVNDKLEALAPCKYNLAIENGAGDHVWTEKLTDAWLAWSFPFYAGCSNADAYFPSQAFEAVDLDAPTSEAHRMVREIQNGRWDQAQPAITEARNKVLHQENIMVLMADLAEQMMARPVSDPCRQPRYIWSERALLPEKGCRGSYADWAFRNLILTFDRQAELKTRRIRDWNERRKSERRARKMAAIER